MQIRRRNLRNYTTAEGREPFREWITQLRDKKAQMDIEKQLARCTTSFDDTLHQLLADPETANYYLETSLEAYRKDNNIEILIQSVRNVIEAQGGLVKLVKHTKCDPKHLYDVLNGKQPPQLNKLQEILTDLGIHPY